MSKNKVISKVESKTVSVEKYFEVAFADVTGEEYHYTLSSEEALALRECLSHELGSAVG